MLMQPLKTLLSLTLLKLIFIATGFCQAPVKNYEQEWKKIDELITKKKLPKSALAEVKKIYALAKKEKQDAQLIKAVVYMTGLQNETREENEALSIKEVEKEIAISKEPVTSILKSLLAEMYWNYFEDSRLDLYDRTETMQFKKEDIRTWGTGDFHKKISELSLQSIKEEKLLQQTRLEPYDAIIIKGNTRHLRPTLYDLLAHRALEYFKNDEQHLSQPAYAFEIDQPGAFAAAADFIKTKFSTRDTASLQHKALLVYQKLLAFHLNDSKPDALLDADIQRLEFVQENSTHPDKDSLYRQALNKIANWYGNLPAAAQAWYLLAKEFNDDGNKYEPLGDTTHRFARLKAREICERVISQKDSSEGKINCINLLNEINRKELKFTLEKVNVPGQPFRSLVEYRNLDRIFLRIIKADSAIKARLNNYYDDKMWQQLFAITPIAGWQQALPATGDHQEHGVEIKIDALPAGEYVLLAASENFSKEAVAGARLFYVSNISFVHNDKDYFLLHRETGQPLAGASIQVWQQVYDFKSYKYTTEKGRQYKTDNNGFFRLTESEIKDNNRRRENYRLEINWNNEKLFMDEWQYDYYYYRENDEKPEDKYRIFFFTDRSMYRPGQTVFFKGIAARSGKDAKNSVAAGFKTKIYLENANGEDIDSLELTTSEYGSFSGKFQLPTGVLNGEFAIYDEEEYGRADFSVEEYKRPKFYVEYEKIKGTFQLNEKIKVTGMAKAYAGNSIDGALVKYRVVREPRFIYSWFSWRWWQPPSKQMEIAHGEAKTDREGKFVIGFEAIPDKTIDKKFEPVFDYRVYADVTDINGETRSGETVVTVGYKSLILSVNLPASLPADSFKTISIRTENMAGEFEPANVKVIISKLKEEKRLIRKRYWERPDLFVMSKEDYIRNFPIDEYDNETDFRSWEKGAVVFEKADSARENGKWPVHQSPSAGGKMENGFYIIEISTKDKNGEEVKDVKFIELFDENSRQLNKPQYLWTQGSRQIEPGEKTEIKLGTAVDNLFVIQQTGKTTNNKLQTTNYEYLILNNEKKTLAFSATEADRGGYGVSFIFVKHNRFYQYNDVIQVPWSNKELKIEYATYRDKTLPGSEEKWKIKISGYKKEQVAAEMLASMYDASLDQFRMHKWNEPSIWSSYFRHEHWNGNKNFSKVNSIQKWISEIKKKPFVKSYDALLEYRYQSKQLLFEKLASGDFPGIELAADNLEEVAGATTRISIRGISSLSETNKPLIIVDGVIVEGYGNINPDDILHMNVLKNAEATTIYGARAANGVIVITTKKGKPQELNEIKARKNFNETAFFFPDLRTDSSGAIEFSFTMPEALTRWKFQALSHTKELAFGYSSKEIITQKQLMVQPNAPRFLREGDKLELSAKIVNLTDKEMTGQAELELFDAATNQSVSGWFRNMFPNQYFTVAAGQSEAVTFPVEVPYQFDKALVWRIVARSSPAGEGREDVFSDGEEAAIPVLTNRMLVTETMPLNRKGTGTKNFKFEKLISAVETQNVASLQHHALTIEYTSNPAWYAVQALPFLMEFPYECAEQTWNRYYANALASKIAGSSPRIKEIFSKWLEASKAPSPTGEGVGGEVLLSNLQKNQELKAVLLEETPWVLQAKTEEQQKKNIALLFDMIRMSHEQNSAFEKLKQVQSENGGFVWFKGGPDNRYITQYIIAGIGHLKKLAVDIKKLEPIVKPAIAYLDKKIKDDYDRLKKNKPDLKKYVPGHTESQYLYMRSFFTEYPISNNAQAAYNFYRKQAQQTWTKQSKYMQGMIALALFRTGDKTTPAAIMKSLKETSITHEELGRYWKENSGGMYWHQAAVETQALLIEVFSEIGHDTKTTDELKTWLLKNKQTSNWKTTKATAEACYALLLKGSDWLANEPTVEIRLGDLLLTSSRGGGTEPAEAGTGYFKKTIIGPMITSDMGNITISAATPKVPLQGDLGGWGAVYWQYFEDLDKITPSSTPLKLNKKLFVETNTDTGPVLKPVNEGDVLRVGDKIKVRIELLVDRDMEFVHMKDMRASSLEPVNVLSSYKWQGGLGYYETTKDASTNFFFDHLRKGTHVFEYVLFVTHAGNFSNGVTSIQCMYAPEFSSHSEGGRITVE